MNEITEAVARIEDLVTRTGKVGGHSAMVALDDLRALIEALSANTVASDDAEFGARDVEAICDEAVELAGKDGGRPEWRAAYHAVMLTRERIASQPADGELPNA